MSIIITYRLYHQVAALGIEVPLSDAVYTSAQKQGDRPAAAPRHAASAFYTSLYNIRPTLFRFYTTSNWISTFSRTYAAHTAVNYSRPPATRLRGARTAPRRRIFCLPYELFSSSPSPQHFFFFTSLWREKAFIKLFKHFYTAKV